MPGQQIADDDGEEYDLLRRNCQDLIDRLLRRILVSDALTAPKYKKTVQQRYGPILDILPGRSIQKEIGVFIGKIVHSS